MGPAFLALLVALPPPLCRGRSADAFDPSKNQTPQPRAVAEVRAAYDALCPLVMKSSHCGTGELYENPTIGNNAVTWVSGLGQGEGTRVVIVYSAPFLNGLNQSFGPGASFGVLAHEVGHHLTAAGNLRKQFDGSWDEELRADWFAGCALARRVRPANELESALRAIVESATQSHPGFPKRSAALRAGFKECTALQRKSDVDQVRSQPAFGIGEELRFRQKDRPCWTYFYRRLQRMQAVGPIAADRLHSRSYRTRAACEGAKSGRDDRVGEPCRCM